MILYRRRIDYKALLLLTTGIAIIPLIIPLIPREISTLLFYIILIPAIIILSIRRLLPRET